MSVATLTDAHVHEYKALMLHAYEHAPDAFTSTAEERAVQPESWWRKRIADPDGLGVALGYFRDARLLGTVAIEFSAKPKTRHKALVIGMYVLPEARGQGAGHALLQAAIALCKARASVTVVQLTVTQGNAAAINLYRSTGFKEFGVEPMAMREAGGYLSKVHMWLPLDTRESAP